jgi:hypothetical protein
MKKILAITLFASMALSGISIGQTINFPDPNFKAAILANGVDLDKDREIQVNEAEACLVLDVSSRSITDLTGIETFKNLKELTCNWNNITTIDLSQNLLLEGLYCASNQITKIDLSKNEKLISLAIDENPLTSINISENLELTKLTITKTQLTGLDVTKNTKLLQLNCTANPNLKFVTVAVINAAISNKKFKKDEATQWTEKSKAAQGQRR